MIGKIEGLNYNKKIKRNGRKTIINTGKVYV